MVRFSAFATISLCGSFQTIRKYNEMLYPDEPFDSDSANELADLIARFVMGGMRALKLAGR